VTPQRWARIKEVFGPALETPKADRPAFLDSACGSDVELRAELERLLAESDGTNTSLHSPANDFLNAAVELAPGDMVAHYRIEGKLGEGGVGVVYKARDTRLNRFVAVKLLRTARPGDQDHIRRFTQEARTASGLNHPNIVTIHEISTHEGAPFIVMEYVPGKSLDCLIPHNGMALGEVVNIGGQVAGALAAATAAGVIHRDVKPGNVMVSDSGQVKVLDFGLAKLSESAVSEALTGMEEPDRPRTREGAVLGTASYMSPEQAEGKPVYPRSDIFSFGAVLYEMSTGQRAFRGETAIATIASILRDEPKLARIPQQLEGIITRCLRKDPVRRFQSMADVGAALIEAQGAQPRFFTASKVAAAMAVVLLGVGVWLVNRRTPSLPPPKVIPFTSTGTAGYPSFSPDGNLLAFQWGGPNRDDWGIYVQQIGAGSPLRLTTHQGSDRSPVFSPDGRYIAFSREALALILVPAQGGPERELSTFHGTPIGQMSGGEIDFSPDGKTIAVSDFESAGDPPGIFLVSVQTGNKKRLTTAPPGSGGDLAPKFSPDGEQIAFHRLFRATIGELRVVAVRSGESRLLSAGNRQLAGLAWMADGRQIVFSARREGLQRLWILSSSGGTPQEMPMTGENARWPAVARKGQRLAYDRQVSDENIWRLDLPGDTSSSSRNLVRLIASTRSDQGPRYSPDGKKIAFQSDRAGSDSIWVSNADGSSQTQLTSMAGNAPSWSPDGRRIAFNSAPDGNVDIYVIGAQGGAPKRITTNPAVDTWPSWSTDGRWIYFSSDRTGKTEIWRVPAEGGVESQLTHHGGWIPQESPDGKAVYYQKEPSNTTIWKIPAEGSPESPVSQSARVTGMSSWRPFNDGIYFVQRVGYVDRIQFFDFASQKITTLGQLEKPAFLGLSLTPDRRQMIFSQVDQHDNDIMLVENFR
jgi:Tol biopolymer transport system component/serine/threonine protein kinase